MDWNTIGMLLKVAEMARGHAIGSPIAKIHEKAMAELETLLQASEEELEEETTDE